MINAGSFDLSEQFKMPESMDCLPDGCGFRRPDGWLEGMEEVKEMLDVPLESVLRASEMNQ